jgi:hypothetical protein
MKYDDASWHYGGDFPSELSPEHGATHIAMFLAWAVGRDLVGELHREEAAEELQQLRQREITPVEFFVRCCDEKLTDEDFNEEGNAFARSYFSPKGGTYGPYLDDYARTLAAGLPTVYHVADTWDNFDKLAPVIDRRFERWRRGRGRPRQSTT